MNTDEGHLYSLFNVEAQAYIQLFNIPKIQKFYVISNNIACNNKINNNR